MSVLKIPADPSDSKLKEKVNVRFKEMLSVLVCSGEQLDNKEVIQA